MSQQGRLTLVYEHPASVQRCLVVLETPGLNMHASQLENCIMIKVGA